MMKIKIKSILTFLLFFIVGCSVSPGMHMVSKQKNGLDYVYIDSINENILIEQISENIKNDELNFEPYKIGNGDQISITVWGLPDIFPINNISPDQNLRRVDSNGNIYFPYVGEIMAATKTQNELRELLSKKLSENFNSPQLDVSIARFNSQKIYLLGEVLRPAKINITDVPISLSDAIGNVKGINNSTAAGSEVFIIRNSGVNNHRIFRADLSTPSGFIDASKFFLEDNDIVYVNASRTTRWNRVISQFFPFSSFLNSVDNLVNQD